MAQQPEACDVRAGMDLVPVRPKLVQQPVLAAGHHRQDTVDRGWRHRSRHGSGKQHAGAQGAAQKQRIPRLNPPFPPGRSMAASVDTERQLKSQFRRFGRIAAGFQRVAANQGCPLLLQD